MPLPNDMPTLESTLGPPLADPVLARFLRALRRSDRSHLYLLILRRPEDIDLLMAAVRAARPTHLVRHLTASDGLDALVAEPSSPCVTILNLIAESDRLDVVREFLQRFNERRNLVMAALRGELVILLTLSQERMVAESAPDVWAIRSGAYLISGEGEPRPLLASPFPSHSTAPLEPLVEDVERARDSMAEQPAAVHAQAELAAALIRASEEGHGRDLRTRVWAEEALALLQALPASTPDRDGLMARALVALGDALAAEGSFAEATARTKEAVVLLRRLAEAQARGFQPDLALALLHLGGRSAQGGSWQDALRYTSEAVEIAEALNAQRPGVFTALLAATLNGLAVRRSTLGLNAEALEASTRAVAILAPSTDPLSRARCLINHGKILSDVGRLEEAIQTTQDAVALYQDAASEAKHSTELPTALTNLGQLLAGMGRLREALAASREAVALWHRVAEEAPGRFAVLLAVGLTNQSLMEAQLGDAEAAERSARAALKVLKPLVSAPSELLAEPVAAALTALGGAAGSRGELEVGVASLERAAALYRGLAARRPGVFLSRLAGALNNLSNLQASSGAATQAIESAREAVQIFADLSEQTGLDGDRADWATALTTLAHRLSEEGTLAEAEAEAVAGAAVELWRGIDGARWPRRDVALAQALNTRASFQARRGAPALALLSLREAGDLIRDRGPVALYREILHNQALAAEAAGLPEEAKRARELSAAISPKLAP
jgi:tetratricopeptide (TPR) repeat protein